jgi:LTXXQ motif family protein
MAMFKPKSCVSLMLALGLLTAPALAQQAAQPEHHPGGPMMGAGGGMMGAGSSMMGAGGTGWQRMMGAGGMGMMSAMAGHVEGRLAFLKTELKITDAQLPLWNKFADALRNNAKTMGEVMQGVTASGGQSAALPDRLATREKFLTARLDTLCNLKAAVDPLYAALSEEQKKTADQIMLTPMGMMM